MKAQARPRVTLIWRGGVDGRLAPARGAGVRPGSAADRAQLRRMRAAADALLVGAGTIAADDPPMRLRDEALREDRLAAGQPAEPRSVIVSGRGRVPATARVFAHPEPPLVALASDAPAALEAALPAPCWRAPAGAPLLPALLAQLAADGVRELLAEGGARLFGGLFAIGAVDALAVTVAPYIDGDGGPPAIEGWTAGERAPRLALADLRREGDELFCRYDVLPGAEA